MYFFCKPSNIMSFDLSRGEMLDLGLMFGGGLLLGIGTLVFRIYSGRPAFGLPRLVFQTQYGLGFIFLGLCLAFRSRVRTTGGLFLVNGLLVALVIALILPASGLDIMTLASLAILGAITFLLLTLYYRISRPTNQLLIFALALMGLEFYLYGIAYNVMAVVKQKDIFFTIGILVGTSVVIGYGRILQREYQRSYAST